MRKRGPFGFQMTEREAETILRIGCSTDSLVGLCEKQFNRTVPECNIG